MPEPSGSAPSRFEGLQVTSAELFPLNCPRCQRRFTDVKDYIARTTPVLYTSGILQHEQPGSGTLLLLLRNCLCGNALALRCRERRSQTNEGIKRRNRFGHLVALLQEAGVSPAEAEAEVRRLLQAGTA